MRADQADRSGRAAYVVSRPLGRSISARSRPSDVNAQNPQAVPVHIEGQLDVNVSYRHFPKPCCRGIYFVWLGHQPEYVLYSTAYNERSHARSSFDELRQLLEPNRFADEGVEAAAERFSASGFRPQGRYGNGFRGFQVVFFLVRADQLN